MDKLNLEGYEHALGYKDGLSQVTPKLKSRLYLSGYREGSLKRISLGPKKLEKLIEILSIQEKIFRDLIH